MHTDLIIEIEQTWAFAERRLVDVVGRLRPEQGAMTFDLADGVAVLAGPGLYVNQVMGAGLTSTVSPSDLDHLEEHAAEVGVDPAFDVCDATMPEVVEQLRSRGYVPDDRRLAVAHSLDAIPTVAAGLSVEFVDAQSLPLWQAATAAGWGHETPARRAASDLYGAAAFEVDDPGLMACRDEHGDVVGAAMLRIEGRIATLGAMSTRPTHRRRGVQSTLVSRRLRLAKEAGCVVATTSVEPDGASYRNLQRLGFALAHVRTTWTRSVV